MGARQEEMAGELAGAEEALMLEVLLGWLVISRLMEWLGGELVGWLIDWLVGSLVGWLIDWLID